MSGQGNRNRRPVPQSNNAIGDWFTQIMNSTKTGVGTPQARNIGSENAVRPSQPAGEETIYGSLPSDYKATESATFEQTRNIGKTNPYGIPQKGTQTSPAPAAPVPGPTGMNQTFAELLAGTGVTGGSGYSSNKLHSNIGPVADGQQYADSLASQGTSGIGPLADGGAYSRALQNAPERDVKGIGPVANGQEYAKSLGKGGSSKPSLEEALADKDGINSYMSKFSSDDRERARRRAFLDGDDSYKGLRAMQALDGVAYAGGKHYKQGDSPDSPAEYINKEEVRSMAKGKAQGRMSDADIKRDFSRTETITPGIQQPKGADVKFKADSPDTEDDFGKSGGFKSGYERMSGNGSVPFM